MTRKHAKEDAAPERCVQCRHENAAHRDDGCRLCLILVNVSSPCYPKRNADATSQAI